MEISRAVELPVSLINARQRLDTALATPLVIQQGNFILAKIVCSGRLEGNELRVQYVEYGGRYNSYINLTGHLEETQTGVRLHMTISSDNTLDLLVYIPLGAVILFSALSSINSGSGAAGVSNYLFLLVAGGALTFLARSLNVAFFQTRTTRLEGVLVQTIMGRVEPDAVV
ncbi:hypothetical protein J2I47_05825 [Fibrella sp. HMF5335]|uniref:Uncharacterized protein n=1 Tax=Fibrella rubiginis TaxID=2817060 RepID=A0A939GF35_9BACT|nr:hypothetical protein [Fibrella rubiginis]MBO0936059.1 hypothetical protein [Fibrella rubiginis]